MVRLVSSLSALHLLTMHGPLSSGLMHAMGSACPQLYALTIIAGSGDAEHVQTTVSLLPNLLPNISHLAFQKHESDYILPDISNNSKIVDLDLEDYRFKTPAAFQLLPSSLHSLRCYTIGDAVPAINSSGTPTLGNLNTLTLQPNDMNPWIGLSQLAQLLRAAPVLKSVAFEDDSGPPSIDCDFDETSNVADAASNLALLLKRTDVDVVRNGQCRICFDSRESHAMLKPLIDCLPCMLGITQCELRGMVPGELGLLVKLFPDVTHMLIQHTHEFDEEEMLLDDEELLCVEACTQLTSILLSGFSKLTSLGLLTLCERLPLLKEVVCCECAQLGEPVLKKCVQLLGRLGKFVEINGIEFDQGE